MAVPTVPTASTLITEAFARCGVSAPTAAQMLRAEDEWFEEVKRDLCADKRWHALEETMVMLPEVYTQIYALPSPLIRVLQIRWYRGSLTGTATAGGTATITVPATLANAGYLGRKIFLTGGTGSAQSNRLTGLSGTVYTVSCDWTTVPAADTTFMIPEIEREVVGPEPNLSLVGLSPSSDYIAWDYYHTKLRFYPPLLNVSECAMEIDGIVDISLIDKTDARLTRILREWRSALLRGLIVRIKEDQDDADVDRDERKYEQIKTKLMRQDSQKRRSLRPPAARSVGGLPRRRML